MSEVTAYVTEENGQVVLHDPMYDELARMVESNARTMAYIGCQDLYEKNLERVKDFRRRFDEKKYSPEEYCIVIIQVDDCYGGPISGILMPGQDWQPIRDQGLEPIARGIAGRKFIRDAIGIFDENAAKDLDTTEYAVVVVANSVAEVFAV